MTTYKTSRILDGRRPESAKIAAPAEAALPLPLISLLCLGLALLVTIPYAQVGTHEFTICDDNDYIYENPQVRQGLTYQGFLWAMEPHAGNWHPLTWLSHMLDWQLFGENAGAHHVENVLFHIAAAIVLFLALRMMTGAIWPSVVVAAFFAIHPLRVESVAWAAERKDVLGALFWMLTMWAYAWYAKRTREDADPLVAFVLGLAKYALVLVAFGLGLASKSMLVTLPCALVLLDLWPLRRWALLNRANPATCRFPPRPFWWLFLEKIPLFLMAFLASREAVFSQDLAVALNTSEGLPLNYRICNALECYVSYLGKTVCPINLAVFYPHDAMLSGHTQALPGATFLQIFHQQLLAGELVLPFFAGCFLLAITLAVVAGLCLRRPYLAIGWFWFVGTLVPVIGLVQVGTQSMADRYSYIPSIGLYIAVVWGLSEVATRWPRTRPVFIYAVSVLLLGCLALTWHQVTTWKTSYTLFTHAAKVVPRNYFAYNHLGKAYDSDGQQQLTFARMAEMHGDHQEAKEHEQAANAMFHNARIEFEKSIKIKPDYDFGNNNLAVCYARESRYAEAEVLLRKALQVNPRYADAYNNMGVVCSNQKRYAEAVLYHKKGMETRPDRPSDHRNLGRAYEQLGDTQRTSDPQTCLQNWKLAANEYLVATQLDPSDGQACCVAVSVLGKIYQCYKDSESLPTAVKVLNRWLSHEPNAQGFAMLGVVFAELGDMAQAEANTRHALELDPQNPVAAQNLKVMLDKKAHPDKK